MADTKATSAPTPLPRVRTYARDLEMERQRRAGAPAANVPAASAPGATLSPAAVHTTPETKTSPLPPSNDRTSAPLPTTSTHTLNTLDTISVGPSLSESVAAAVSATTKHRTVSEPAVPVVPEAKAVPAAVVAPVSIPPFHEFTRTSQPTPARPSPAPNDFGATIITDTQSRRFKLFPNLLASLSRWWEARARKRAAARAPKYVIPETDRRKGVIQRATSQTAKVATGDYEGLRQRLRERVEATVAAPEPIDREETFWTPHVESIFPLLEAPQYTPSSVQKVTLTPLRKLGDTQDSPFEASEPDDRWQEAARAYSTPAPTVIQPTPEPEPTPTPAPQPTLVQTTPPPTPVEDPDEDAPLPAPVRRQPSTNPNRRPIPTSTRRQFLFHTNTITISIVGVVVLSSLALYLTPQLLKFSGAPAAEEAPTPTQSSVIAAPIVTRPLTIPSRDGIMTALAIAEEERTLPAIEVILTGDTSPASLLQTIDPALPPSFVQNVSAVSFGWYDRTEPFIIMSISDRTSVWGSLLQNEDRLPKTLAPLFVATSTGRFVDRVVGGHDVRTLVDATKSEHLSYGLIDDHTLLITTDTATFLSVETLVTTVR